MKNTRHNYGTTTTRTEVAIRVPVWMTLFSSVAARGQGGSRT